MTINKIKGNNYGPKKSERSDAVSKSSDSKKGSGASKAGAAAGKGKDATNVSLSGSKFESELSFAKNILGNARKNSLVSLKKIKQKINAGEYNTEAVHKEISSFISNDISSLENLFSQSVKSKSTSSVITAERKQHLLENPEVTQKIADQIARQLKNL